MRLANEKAEIAQLVLNKCAHEVRPAAPWHWHCVVQNGTRLHMAASLQEGFLHLEYRPEGARRVALSQQQALLGNSNLRGGVKLALGAADNRLRLATDMVVLEEKQLHDRFVWALDGFHDGERLLRSPASRHARGAAQPAAAGDLPDLLREAAWPSTERSPSHLSAELDSDSAPPANIAMTENGIAFSVELARPGTADEAIRKALAVFLLTATGALRLVRAYAAELDGTWACGVQVTLPAVPAVEEIDHALAALSIAHRACAREANVLLNQAAACCYLAARDTPTTSDQPEKEN